MNTAKIRWNTVTVLSFAHLMTDLYHNCVPQLIPFLLTAQGFTLTSGASLVAVFTITSSLSQPVFGYLADQKGQRWLVYLGTLWMSILIGITGTINNYYLLLVICTLAGLGTAAFHPQAAAMVGQESGERKGFVLALFTATGNFGSALSPLIMLPVFAKFGLKSTLGLIPPGLLTAWLLYKYAPLTAPGKFKKADMDQTLSALKKASGQLSKLMLVVALRSTGHTGTVTLLPIYLLTHDYSVVTTSYMMFFTLAAGAIGGVIGGYISDRYGRKLLIVSSLCLASCFFYIFLYTSGPLSVLFLGLGGMSVLSTFSVTVAASQEIIPENKALASGLSLGFSIGMGGLAVTPLGYFADIYGISPAIHLAFILPLVAGLLALTLKNDRPAQVKTETA